MTTTCHNCDRPCGDSAHLCTTCTRTLAKQLRSVPGLIDDMTLTRARIIRMSRWRNGGRSAETPVPVSLLGPARLRPTDPPLSTLATEICTWALDVADRSGRLDELQRTMTDPEFRRIVNDHRAPHTDPAALSLEPAHGAGLAAIWLADHANELRHHPAADEMFDAITDAIAAARRVVDRLPDLRFKGQCTHTWTGLHGEIITCAKDLYVEAGDDYARCAACGAHHEVRELNHQIMAKMHEMLYTAGELATLLTELGHRHVASGTVRSWASRRRITPRGWKRDGRITDHWIHRNDPPVYRLGDVLAIAESEARNTARVSS